MQSRTCPLCWIVTGAAKTPFEHLLPDQRRTDQILVWDRDCAIVIDVAPIGHGHCLIITRHHRCSMAEARAAELDSVRQLMREAGRRILRGWGGGHVFFEHGQRREGDEPFGCGISHAHLHAVATSAPTGQLLSELDGVEFTPHASGIGALRAAVGPADYLYVEDQATNAWLATPKTTASQLLRRRFLDPGFADGGTGWNWSDQVMLAEQLGTRDRVLANLAGLGA